LKKYSTLIFTVLLVFIAACGNEDASSNAENNNNDDQYQEGVEEEKTEVEVTDVKYYKWIDEAVDSETITMYAEIKNTGDADVDAGYANLTFLDSAGNVISVQGDEQVSPRFMKKDSIGYISAEVENDIDKYDDLDKIEIEVSPEPFQDAEIVELKTKDTNLNVDNWGQEDSKISVTGFFENESNINFNEDDTSAIIGLYDKEDNFLAVESMYMDQEFSIDANGETSFEIGGGSPLPPEIREKVDRAEVKAIGIENMEDYWW